MRDSRVEIARMLLLFMLILAAGAGSCAAVIRWSEAEFFERAAAVAAAMPDQQSVLMRALKEPETWDIQAGRELLGRYGYDGELLGREKLVRAAGITTLAALAVTGIMALSMLLRERRERRRLDGLVAHLRRVERGEYPVLTRSGEDRFSVLEDEIGKTVTQLRETREEALRERKMLAENLADISHQLKTPLTSITLTTELLAERLEGGRWEQSETERNAERAGTEYNAEQAGTERNAERAGTVWNAERAGTVRNAERAGTERNAEQSGTERNAERAGIERIAAQAKRLGGLVASLLALSRLDADALDLKKRRVPAAELISCAAEPVRALLEKRGQTLNICAGECEVECDLGWTAEALGNILKNCSEHAPEHTALTVGVRQNPLFTEIIIEDEGTGFAGEELPHIFERFYRGSGSDEESAGIGLALAKGIVERQNGSVRAENRREGGARFAVRFYGG